MYNFIKKKKNWKAYLFIPCIHVHFLGADGLADMLDVVLSAIVKNIFVFFPTTREEILWKNVKQWSHQNFYEIA